MNNSKTHSKDLIFQLFHKKLQEKFPKMVAKRKEVVSYFAMCLHIPKEISVMILKDLNEAGLVEIINRDMIGITENAKLVRL